MLSTQSVPRALLWTIVLAVAAGIAVFVPIAPWLILALWFASLVRPVLNRFARVIHGRHRAAAILTLALIALCVTPVVVIVVSISNEATELAQKIAQSQGGQSALKAIVSPGDPEGGAAAADVLKMDPKSVMDLAQQHGGKAWQMLATAAGAATSLLIGLFLFFWGAYVVLVDGPKAYVWLSTRLPIEGRHLTRFVEAFKETGRGLLVGIGLTGFVQASVATIGYFALGVPRALVLGLFTLIASMIPSIGCALVWVPVAAGLALSGQTGKAAILVAIGVGVVSTVDNVLRPIFSRYGHLQLPSYVIIVSMFGGLALFGGWGLLFGPLFVRLAREALDIYREERLAVAVPVTVTEEEAPAAKPSPPTPAAEGPYPLHPSHASR